MINVGINGFGRIGRLVLRASLEKLDKKIRVVAINDIGNINQNVHLFKYDTVHGKISHKTEIKDNNMLVDGNQISFFDNRAPEEIPWNKNDVDIVLECTGLFTNAEKAKGHLNNNVKKVLISAPSSNADITVVHGVNDKSIKENHNIVSNASCTTNCLAPVAKVINEKFIINAGFMTTVHSFTSDQKILDSIHSDLRRARTAGSSMIPTSTGAAKAVGLVLPELNGKLDGTAVRIPTPNVSMIDFTFQSQKKLSIDSINNVIYESSLNEFKNIIEYNTEPLVSIDFNHNPASSIFDATQTQVVGDNFGRILAWYDNEWGFSNRMIDVCSRLGNYL
ncbi:MAG: Glyceraldehyde-3-phosphate dehydrogenase 1 [Alphaproteobacteria bacterium MarineAlpha9_Bin4]|nr:type I glyceraldehyde-3-phosphate dehydrogenase [Pelagibacterales bacterium]PPR25757.1 MAG: Glyceraldehyde-3-phosphate dehydrogenase 1 [Alphaproteobacteria bacterium MarineAlpha9_Bin4]|tara:strand:- start:379 stop:1383 length:1005 start_codon:yes stop_codon:yes gene_type:complete